MVTHLENDELLALMAEDSDLQLLDVRTPEEHFYLGHVPDVTLIPIHELLARYTELDKAKKTVVICEHGVRSYDASLYLEQRLGFAQVYNLTHGMAEWTGPRVIPAEEVPSNEGHAGNQPNMAEWTGPRVLPVQDDVSCHSRESGNPLSGAVGELPAPAQERDGSPLSRG
jgi:rhodanese-related sulfurtransferase